MSKKIQYWFWDTFVDQENPTVKHDLQYTGKTNEALIYDLALDIDRHTEIRIPHSEIPILVQLAMATGNAPCGVCEECNSGILCREVQPSTNSCYDVWDAFRNLRNFLTAKTPLTGEVFTLVKKIEDAFCDFECSWEAHAREHHLEERRCDGVPN